MVLLQRCCWKFSQKETLWQTLFDQTWILFTKTTNSFIQPPLGGVRGNVHVRASSIARWKARDRFSIRYNWTFFVSSYGSDVISRYWSKSALFKGRLSLLSANFRRKGTSPTNICRKKTRVITLSCGIKMSAVCSFVSSQSTRVTDRRRDRQTDRIIRSQRPRWHSCFAR